MDMPPAQYANNDGVHIAYRTCGDGEDVVVTSGATVTMELIWPLVEDVAEGARVTWYDKRGTGASDGVANFSFEERMDDIRAVMDAAGIEAAHLTGASEGGPQTLLFAATYPQRVRSITIYGSYPSRRKRPDYPYGWEGSLSEYAAFVDRIMAASTGDPDARAWFWDMWSPSLAATPGFLDSAPSNAPSTSPAAARLIWEAMYDVDVRSILPSIHCPTTIVHRTGDRVAPIEGGRYLAEHIAGAKLIEVPGDDHFPSQVAPVPEWPQAILENIATGVTPPLEQDRRLATVLFTDIVDSTATAAELGDRRWTELLDRHDQLARQIVAAHEGTAVKSTGDGLLATFDGPSRAVRCAGAIQTETEALGVPVRAGLHAGEIELRGADVAGIAVHIAARVAGLGGAGETVVSRTVRDLVGGSGFDFEDLGDQTLKGVESPWQCYRLRS